VVLPPEEYRAPARPTWPALSDRWEKMARAAGAFTTLPVALAFHALSDCLGGHFRHAGARWAEMAEILAVCRGPGVLGVNSHSNGLLLTSADTSSPRRICSAETTQRRCPTDRP
jgi:hypothetical protein